MNEVSVVALLLLENNMNRVLTWQVMGFHELGFLAVYLRWP